MSILTVPSCCFPNIQSAVNAANPYDTIKVCPGKYCESITINTCKTGIKIIAACPCSCILYGNDCCSNYPIGINIKANQVTIDGFIIKCYKGHGIKVGCNSNGCILKNNLITCNGSDGIRIEEGCCRNSCIRNTCSYNKGDGCDIRGNLNYVIKCTLKNNCCDGCDLSGNSNLCINSECYCNKDAGIKLCGNCCLISGNCCYNNAIGIAVYSCGNTIYNNTVKCNSNTGILVDNGNSNSIISNCVMNCLKGVCLQRCDNNIVDNNTIKCNKCAGIYIDNCTCQNAIRENTILYNCPNIKASKQAQKNNIINNNNGCNKCCC